MLDYRTMEPEIKMARKGMKKQIFIVQGDLDDKALKDLELEENEGYLLVTGNVTLFKEYSMVKCGLVVLGNCYLCKISVHGSLSVYGNLKTEGSIVHGNLCANPNAEVGELFLVGERIFC